MIITFVHRMDDDNKYQINLQQLIEDYVWGEFRGDMFALRRPFTRRRHYEFDIRWGFMDFTHTTESKERPVTGYTTLLPFIQSFSCFSFNVFYFALSNR